MKFFYPNNYIFTDWITVGEKAFDFLTAMDGEGTATQCKTKLRNTFIHLALYFAHHFRYELLKLSDTSCKRLAHMHFLQIKHSLQRSINNGFIRAITKKEDLFSFLLTDSKKEIEGRIQVYISERKARFFRSENYDREDFLRSIQADIKLPNVNLKPLIDKISQKVFFKDDVYDWLWKIEVDGTTLSQKRRCSPLSFVERWSS